MSLQLAAAWYIYIHYGVKEKRKERRWWQTQMDTTVQRFKFAGRLEFLADQWVIQEFHQNVSQ
jgi:hypothetical protein